MSPDSFINLPQATKPQATKPQASKPQTPVETNYNYDLDFQLEYKNGITFDDGKEMSFPQRLSDDTTAIGTVSAHLVK